MKKTNLVTVKIFEKTGVFGEDKDLAKQLRTEFLWPAIKDGRKITLDFSHVEDVTQSFIHALLSELIRETEGDVLDNISFKNCNETVKKIINMVVSYMLE
ncbi:MAG: STAS-like domain-containing protein [Patescibacteria group bacterium]|nr:STAS-like domain-containing protein [Patescibacteria group bacterium]